MSALLVGFVPAPGSLPADEPQAAPAKADSKPEPKPDDPAEKDKAAEKPAEAKEKKAAAGGARKLAELVETVGAAAAEAVGAVVAEVDPLEQQYAPQMKQILASELRFVRTVCQPKPDQYQIIKAAGDASVKRTLKSFAAVQKQMQQGIRPGQEAKWPDPQQAIASDLAAVIEKTLSVDQTQRYRKEIDKRAAARKRSAVLNIVARLDRELVLTADQRKDLAAALEKNWKDSWGAQLEVFLYGDQYTPIPPDDQVRPLLNEKQKSAWKGIPRNQNVIWGWLGFGFMQPVEIVEELPAEAEQAADKEAAGQRKEPNP